ncbi:MAG: hypothetical protein OEZ01_17945, partial [Candidatus Heimdallarchaeota archaeon]|nr:hypothetical protein [Candidatus Heimdallarchaeota archaeon]
KDKNNPKIGLMNYPLVYTEFHSLRKGLVEKCITYFQSLKIKEILTTVSPLWEDSILFIKEMGFVKDHDLLVMSRIKLVEIDLNSLIQSKYVRKYDKTTDEIQVIEILSCNLEYSTQQSKAILNSQYPPPELKFVDLVYEKDEKVLGWIRSQISEDDPNVIQTSLGYLIDPVESNIRNSLLEEIIRVSKNFNYTSIRILVNRNSINVINSFNSNLKYDFESILSIYKLQI